MPPASMKTRIRLTASLSDLSTCPHTSVLCHSSMCTSPSVQPLLQSDQSQPIDLSTQPSVDVPPGRGKVTGKGEGGPVYQSLSKLQTHHLLPLPN